MGNNVVALALAAAGGGWIYAKLSRNTGGNAKSAGTAAVISAFCIYVVVLLVLKVLPF